MTTHATHWHPAAAYLYVLHLDGPALAWEYLRRNPDYEQDWLRYRHKPADGQAQRWGLRLLEDPGCDARDAQPDWVCDPDSMILIRPDDDPPTEALTFSLWQLPGHKRLTHDGKRLMLTCQVVEHMLHIALSPALEEGLAYVYAVRPVGPFRERWRAIDADLALLDAARATRTAVVAGRPNQTSLLHMRALQALDGAQAGASQREVAEVMFGANSVSERWHPDGDLRAQVRRLIRRGHALTSGGYRHLLHPSPVA
jgi:hypothetical protein